MKKISIKNILEFRRKKTEKGKRKFAIDVKNDVNNVEKKDGGGDYWISSVSAISKTFKRDDPRIIEEKIADLEKKFDNAKAKISKTMYERNINVLYNFESFDFKQLKPSKPIEFIRKQKEHSSLIIDGLNVKVSPHHVFSIKKNGPHEIGAIWFVAELNGYPPNELGIFSESLYEYLSIHYSNNYVLNPKYCLAIDVMTCRVVNYEQIRKNEIPAILSDSLKEIKGLM